MNCGGVLEGNVQNAVLDFLRNELDKAMCKLFQPRHIVSALAITFDATENVL